MAEVRSGLSELAQDALTLLGATAVAVRALDRDGGLETLALAGRNAAALVAGHDEPAATTTRSRWRRREHAGPGEPENHPITGITGRQLGWLTLERGPAADTGRLGETALRLVLAQAGALLEADELLARLSAQDELLLERLDQLRASDQALRMAFEESVIGMAMISLDAADAGRYLRVNDALCRLTGYSREELLARPFEEQTHPEDRGPTASAMRRAMAGRRTPFRTEKRFVRSDGSICWVRVTATPLFDDDDRPLYALGQVEDLSVRGEHDAELAARLDPLTGTLNSAAVEQGLVETVQRAHRIGTGCAVLVAELAGFDELVAGDDESGGLADRLQVALARRLQTTLRGSDVISRVDHNQFVIITEEVGPEQVKAVARRLQEALATPETIGGREFPMSANLGVSVLSGGPGDAAGQSVTLLEQARTALVQARVGGGSHVLYLSEDAQPATGTSRTLYAHPDWPGRSGR
ncbi:MAG TPA: PAS domain S-box protein [Jatrophihabitans sp.]|jgi:PAS domain S-box-containing protein/diguanylate cyclase (GGDEF)-like protein|nr:PAS domain S-box protein [Jatrophihabitans sp.]